jgi:autotransporter-associated beta strand protein
MKTSLQRLIPIALVLALPPGASWADTSTWDGAASGNWSVPANWEGDILPPTSGQDIVLTTTAGAGIITTVDSAWATNGSINSLTFSGAASQATTLKLGSTTVDLNIGAGGITWSGTNNGGFQGGGLGSTLNFTASQNWNVGSVSDPSFGIGSIQIDFISDPGVVITKTGTKFIRVFASSGATTGFQGSFTIEQGGFSFFHDNTYDFFGANAVTIKDTNSTALAFNVSSGGAVVRDFDNDLILDGNFDTSTFTITSPSSLSSATSVRLNVDGAISSTAALTGRGTTGSFQLNGAGTSAIKTWINGDNSAIQYGGLSGDLYAVHIRGGNFVLNHANALDTGNSLSVRMGETNTTGGVDSALLATNGNNVSSPIKLRAADDAVIGGPGQNISLGLEGTGAVAFSGNILLPKTPSGTVVPTLHLTAPSGGTATFSGIIQNYDSGVSPITPTPVTVDGGGTVILSNANTYTGSTTVSAGTLLVSNTSGSATGTGNVSVHAGGTLAGTGFISPTGTNGITVQSGGFIAPGDGGIGLLSFSSFDTTGTVATFETGAKFKFDLDASALTSDTLGLTSNAAGDFVFNDNVIDFTLLAGSLAEGQTYTLFTAAAANAYAGLTLDGSNHITDGLFIGTGLGEFAGDSFLSV